MSGTCVYRLYQLDLTRDGIDMTRDGSPGRIALRGIAAVYMYVAYQFELFLIVDAALDDANNFV